MGKWIGNLLAELILVGKHLEFGGKLSNVELVFQPMILEVAILDIKPGLAEEFEVAFKTASTIIFSMSGYISHELQRSLETTNRYILLVRWRQLEDHTVGFRQSAEYQEWRYILHHFYEPFPAVEHYESILFNSRSEFCL